MQRLLLRLFKTKYLEHRKDDTFIGFMLFSMSFKVPVPMMLHVFMDIRREVFNTGFTDSSPMVFKGYGIRTTPGVLAGFLSQSDENCEMKYDVLPENWDIAKICGMALCSLIILKSSITLT